MPTGISILTNFILLSGFGCLTYTYYLRRKQIYFLQLFKNVEKSQKYHLDYVESIAQLPYDKNVLLFGTARSLNNEKIIAKSYIKISKQEDRLWNYKFNDKFNLATSANELIQIEPEQKGQSIIAFNLHKNNEDEKYEQRVIHHNQPICAYGKIYKVGDNGRKMHPQLIMGSKQQQILAFLDKEILKLNKRGKTSFAIGLILFSTHFAYEKILGSKKSKNFQLIQKILNETKLQI